MNKINNLTGNKFGNLTVISFKGIINHKTIWICKCDCGNVIEVKYGELTRKDEKKTISCGCVKRLRYRKEFGESSFNRLFRQYEKDAKRRNLKFILTKNDVKNLTKQNCFYCGKCPSQIVKAKQGNNVGYGDYIYNGIDRIDNTKGYILDNCVPCCGDCNRSKRTLEFDEFRNHIINIYNHWISKS